ncbi:MAG: dicarboxylate--CoA ligase PimA [Rhodospirillaceae bacterium]|nr:MAG: dicarboxylate--CoA ligase PimA [Rhodospirillaceae bacterium]
MNTHPTANIPTGPATRILSQGAEAHPDLDCLDFLGQKMTYGEVWAQVREAARGLQDLGLQKDDRIGLCLPNSPYYVIAHYATLLIGATVVNFNPLYTEREIREQIEDSSIVLMFTLDLKSVYKKVAPALHTTTLRTIVVCALSEALPPIKSLLFQIFKRAEVANVPKDLGHIPFRLLIADKDAPKPVTITPEKDIAVIQYTGGTTGTPKGAMLTHANIRANAEQVRLWLGRTKAGEDKFLCVIPFFHVFAMTAGMNLGLATGSELILLPRFDLGEVLETITHKKPTIFPAVPTIYGAINTAKDFDHFDLTSIRYCISGGAPLPGKVKIEFERLSHCILVEGYGLSEASPVVTCNPPHSENKIGSIGLALPWTDIECRNLENFEQVAAQGEVGELVVRGPQVMSGYLNQKAETDKVLQDGWLSTGDVGYQDEDGYFFLTDRIKDIIICSGFKVYPQVIENALYRHEDVLEVIVIGVPDDYRGEAPMAYVTVRSGSFATNQTLLDFANEDLNRIERPVAVEIRDSLPKTLVGKLSKKDLIKELAS